MEKVKIGINGFGRIGRLLLRESFTRNDIQVVAVNDLMEVDLLAYLLKYDSVHGKFEGEIKVEGNHLIVNNTKIRVTAEKDPANLKWDEVGAEIIADCTGIFKTLDKAEAHLKAGAKKVVLSSPSDDIPMFVMGVNHTELTADKTIISNASCTTNCLAPIAKILNDTFGIAEGLMTTVHAATASQLVVDGASKKDFRGGRAALNNIIPASTGAAQAVTKVIPALKGKLTGMAFRVPVANVSVVDLTVKLNTPTTYEEIMDVFKKASENEYKDIVGFTTEAVVSQDFVSDTRTSIIDADAGIGLNETFFKIVSWYDNEYGYSAKLLDLIVYAHKIQ
ncbi:type I glyceraldehyde-3-phosphate dehydrogenase [Myroides ceti]|jgi:glyceraldehyde 3-phosphate dehydrogenase|uniref:Glyceraldehyde-3-phosphate dehydrogenase n=1 Tax=Paenimyroides ceti TaxID=395087 RepID=A0ABT8CTL9_9FLAO|nr:type I glyceraldehyde-3-phosphate dehydrogenase [Paenimyroides ceti]MDN3706902.1 type I glyceraldehyde-3-phosphate dehydrogenase [Paenimyroides ceti]